MSRLDIALDLVSPWRGYVLDGFAAAGFSTTVGRPAGRKGGLLGLDIARKVVIFSDGTGGTCWRLGRIHALDRPAEAARPVWSGIGSDGYRPCFPHTRPER